MSDILTEYQKAESSANIDEFTYKYMLSKYGMPQLAGRYCESWLLSIKTHAETDDRVNLICRFMGLKDDFMPGSIFRYFVKLVTLCGVKMNEIFARDKSEQSPPLNRSNSKMNEVPVKKHLYVSYQTVMSAFKE